MSKQFASPENIRTLNHRKRLKKWWNSKEWKEYVRIHTEGKCCEECGVKAGEVRNGRRPAILTVNHLYRDLYNSLEDYLKFSSDKTQVTCTTCNWLFEKGMNWCPQCRKRYKKWYQPVCSSCFNETHPEIKEAREREVAELKSLKKKLANDQKQRVKEWKITHPKPKIQPSGRNR